MAHNDKKSSFLHRSRVDIIANILRVAAGGAKKTHIMYGCNLSFKQLQAYMDLLLDKGLLKETLETEEGVNPTVFQTTAKGRNFLHAYRNIRALLRG